MMSQWVKRTWIRTGGSGANGLKKKKDRRKVLFITSLILEHLHLLSPPRQFCKINGVKMLNKAGLFSFQSFAFCGAGVIN